LAKHIFCPLGILINFNLAGIDITYYEVAQRRSKIVSGERLFMKRAGIQGRNFEAFCTCTPSKK
jgi:hypothetical protein